jgi:MarR family transcriptional regulator for hemolysin
MLPERFAIALHATARAWRIALDARLKDLGVGQAGSLAMATLARSKADLSQRALADHLRIEAPAMGAMVDRLAEAGLVTRTACPGDRRIKLVRLTDAGRDLHGQVRMEAEAFRASVLAGVDPALLERVAGLLEALRRPVASEL